MIWKVKYLIIFLNILFISHQLMKWAVNILGLLFQACHAFDVWCAGYLDRYERFRPLNISTKLFLPFCTMRCGCSATVIPPSFSLGTMGLHLTLYWVSSLHSEPFVLEDPGLEMWRIAELWPSCLNFIKIELSEFMDKWTSGKMAAPM